MFTQILGYIVPFLMLGNFVNSQESYVAAVVEYGFTNDVSLSDLDNVLRITRDYVSYIQKASQESNAQIIIFPEYGLTTQNLPSNLENISTLVPAPSEGAIPCLRSDNSVFARFLVDLSCAALEHKTHVVINLIERANSSTNTTIYYNTNVVFDTRGVVRARYRKINLINEDMFTPGEEEVVYTTSFGVTFGLLTSHDLLFKHPAMTLMNDLRVTDLIYPNAWPSELPFLKGLSLQDGFSKAYGVNFLSSTFSNPSRGIGGAGIFLANATIAVMDLSTEMLQRGNTATVAIITTRTPGSVCDENINVTPRVITHVPNIDSFAVTLENMELYTFVDLEMGVNETNGEVCSEGSQFCCEYFITFTSPLTNTSTIYKMAAFYGVRMFPNSTSTIGVRNCALVACQSEDNSTCGTRVSVLNVDFAQITIRTNVAMNEDTSFLPSTLNSALEPLRSYTFCQGDEEDGKVGISMSVERPANVFTFGIFGRAYDLDGREVGKGFAQGFRAWAGLISSLILAALVI